MQPDWLKPDEGIAHATLTGSPCVVMLGSEEVPAEVFRHASGGHPMFLTDGKWVTNDVRLWRPLRLAGTVKSLYSHQVPVKFKRLPHGDGLALPSKSHPTDAGIDVASAQEFSLFPGRRHVVPTGFAIELPEGYEAQVRPRSGLAAKHGITVVNTPGTIDANYRGEVKVILINHGIDLIKFKRGDRIAQLVVQPVLDVVVEEVVDLGGTDRGAGGFGSSGL